MKITKKQLRRIIKEELFREAQTTFDGHPSPVDGKMYTSKPSGESGDPQLAAVLLRDMNQGTVTAEQGDAPDELYIMTGAAEGITIKVLRSGH
jgi:hypothetical protein